MVSGRTRFFLVSATASRTIRSLEAEPTLPPLHATADTRTLSILSFDTWSVGRFSLVASLSLMQLVIGVGVMYAVTAATRRREAAL